MVSFGYFWDGFCHFLVGVLFLFIFIRTAGKKDKLTWEIWLGLVIGSSSLFFLPNRLPFLTREMNYWYQFSHYPISDWDILLLGGPWHRFFLTHSALIPFLLLYVPRRQWLLPFLFGLTIGIASHLVWDGYSSARPMIVFYPKVLYFRGNLAEAWLYANALLLLPVAEIVRRRHESFQ